jgi:16S rRNA (guanine527-N7)-methyltransferase
VALEPTEEFRELLARQQIELEAGEGEKLGRFLALLLETNRQFNLTAVTDPARAWVRHVFDSLTLLPYLLAGGARRVCDVGSGGGLPGLPLAIVLPQVHFTLIEATGKKARFLESAIESLGLANAAVLGRRAEEAGRDEAHRERYDAALARALGPLGVLLEVTVPLVRVGGAVLAIKGQRAAAEVADARRALRLLHARVATVDATPTGAVVVIEKTARAPARYPRRPGEPRRDPL